MTWARDQSAVRSLGGWFVRSVWLRVLLTLALAVAISPAAFAQETTGAIEGVVRDSGGAVMPGATVEATGPSGTVVAVSNERGEYRFPRLPSGKYTVKATMSSFRSMFSGAPNDHSVRNRPDRLRYTGEPLDTSIVSVPSCVGRTTRSIR